MTQSKQLLLYNTEFRKFIAHSDWQFRRMHNVFKQLLTCRLRLLRLLLSGRGGCPRGGALALCAAPLSNGSRDGGRPVDLLEARVCGVDDKVLRLEERAEARVGQIRLESASCKRCINPSVSSIGLIHLPAGWSNMSSSYMINTVTIGSIRARNILQWNSSNELLEIGRAHV